MEFERFHNAEREGWNDRASGYDQATALATMQIIPVMLEAVRARSGQRLLDLACGTGSVAGAAAALGLIAEGVDFAPDMVALAQSRFPAQGFQVADVQNLPHSDASFDIVTCNIGLFHVADPAKALAEAARGLGSGGRFAFSQWAAPAQSELYAALFDILKSTADMSLADPAPNAYRLSDPAIVADMLTTAGFGDIETRHLDTTLIANGADFHDFFMRFGVRVPLIVAAQPADVQARIKSKMNAAMAPYKTATGYEVPMPSLLYSGVLT